MWTGKRSGSPGWNIWDHWKKHHTEFPDIDNAISYFVNAREFTSSFPVDVPTDGSGFLRRWEYYNTSKKIWEIYHANQNTGVLSIQISRGVNKGAFSRFNKPDLNFGWLDWARGNGYKGVW